MGQEVASIEVKVSFSMSIVKAGVKALLFRFFENYLSSYRRHNHNIDVPRRMKAAGSRSGRWSDEAKTERRVLPDI